MPPRVELPESELRNLYEKGMSIQNIANYYDISHGTVFNRMKEYEIETRTISEAHKGKEKYSINADFFKTWTPENAWLFGWALGDGSFTSSPRLTFVISQKDTEVLYKFKEVLESEHPVTDYKQWDKRYQKYYLLSAVYFNSMELVEDLRNLGYSDVPQKLFHHFLRGFFEAEGCVYWHKNKRYTKGGSVGCNISQNDYAIIKFILWRLHEFEVVRGGSIRQQKNTWTLKFGINDSIRLYNYIYTNCANNYLLRKKERFKEMIEQQQE